MTATAAPTRNPIALAIADRMEQATASIWQIIADSCTPLTVAEFKVVRTDLGDILKERGLKDNSTAVYLTIASKIKENDKALPRDLKEAKALYATLPKGNRGAKAKPKQTEGEAAEALATAAKMGQAVYEAATALEVEPADVILLAKEAAEMADYIIAIKAAIRRGVAETRILGAITGLVARNADPDIEDLDDESEGEVLRDLPMVSGL